MTAPEPELAPAVELGLLGATFAALAILGWGAWPDVLVDFGRELYVAWRIAQGDVLYRDVASFYGPLSPYVNGGLFALFGTSLRTLVAANLALLAGVTWMLRALLLRAGTRPWAATAACALFLAVFGFGHLIANGSFNFVCPYAHEATHGFALALGAVLCALRAADTRRAAWAGAAGLFCGLAFLTKPEPFVAAVGTCGVLAALGGRARLAARVGAFAGGLALPPLCAWLLLALAMPAGDAWTGTLGSWAFLGNAQLRAMSYFGWSAGLDRPRMHLAVVARAAAAQAAVLVPAGALAWVLRRRGRHAAVGAALAGAAALGVVLARGWDSRDWLRWARPLPLWTAGLVILAALALARAGGDVAPALRARLALALLALLLLPRILLNARFFHYGFTLAAAGTVVVAAALLDWIPRALERRGAAGAVVRAVGATALAFLAVFAVRDSFAFMARKTVRVGSGGDSFRADARGEFVNLVLENLDRAAASGTLVVLPEGVMINYLHRRPSSIPYLTMLPSDEAQFGEDELLGSLERRPPDLIALVHRTADEFGMPLFGRDYAPRTLQWVQAHYAPAFTAGDPPLQPGTAFGIRVLTRRQEP
jgi:hypothetical protein